MADVRTGSALVFDEISGADGGDPTLLLIHGLGANSGVWDSLRPSIESDWRGPCIIPDLRGHGRSPWASSYSFGTFAADIADLLAGHRRVAIIGHSLGGALGAMLASGWLGVDVCCLLGLSVKTSWKAEDLSKFAEISKRPVRYFESENEARSRFIQAAGLTGIASPDDRVADIGILRSADGAYCLAADPLVLGSTGAQVDVLIRAALAPIRFATGAEDLLAPLSDMKSFDPDAIEIAGAGHNVHAERPAEVWRVFLDHYRSVN